MDNFYFGCWDRPGHFLFLPNGWQAHGSNVPKDFPCRDGALDGGFLPPNLPQNEGRASLWHVSGWTILTFWDRSVDSRTGCCSAFVMRGDLTFEQAVATSRNVFPGIWKRFTFDVFES